MLFRILKIFFLSLKVYIMSFPKMVSNHGYDNFSPIDERQKLTKNNHVFYVISLYFIKKYHTYLCVFKVYFFEIFYFYVQLIFLFTFTFVLHILCKMWVLIYILFDLRAACMRGSLIFPISTMLNLNINDLPIKFF